MAALQPFEPCCVVMATIAPPGASAPHELVYGIVRVISLHKNLLLVFVESPLHGLIQVDNCSTFLCPA